MNQFTPKHYLASLLVTFLAGCGGTNPPPVGEDGGVAKPPCVVGGCSGQLCVSSSIEPPVTTCEWREEYACYQDADCTVQDNGSCGWTPTAELEQCLADAAEPAPTVDPEEPPPAAGCEVGGCSGQLCLPEGSDLASTCEWREEYACYADATCEKQANGKCGWTETDELTACLEDAKPAPTKPKK